MCEEVRSLIEEKNFYLIVSTESSNILYEYKHESFAELPQEMLRLFITSVSFAGIKPLQLERLWITDKEVKHK